MTNQAYLLPVWETITAAWDKVKGAKATLWGAFLLVLVIMFCFGLVEGLFKAMLPGSEKIINIVAQIINFLLQMGVLYIGIQRARDLPIDYSMVFYAFKGEVALNVILLYLLQTLIFFLPALLCIIGFVFYDSSNTLFMILSGLSFLIGAIAIIYLAVRLTLSMAFVLDHKNSAWQAVQSSFSVSRHNFWRIVAVFIIETLIVLLSIIPLGIGLIWTLPFMFIVYGMIYRRLLINL